ncbi:DegV family protein [Mycoplasmopsis caviae]|uniref:DegV family protein n=1 Tax=Mycoplasmopsis caviae TaxID=55603 RepID=A0A3P8KAM6_9BACT|nr:DegV family protein [Mycoplasmopsis caviae]UUD34735.1 DegV family protein [Mycoplasmopsis caviae]VDR42429.1 fatty acid-binding protein DegV-like protein [Mycoplasmopsis caviae]
MKKIGFIVDGFISEPQEKVLEKGYGYLPFIIDIDGSTYRDGVDLEQQEILHKIDKANSVKTSMPSIKGIMDTVEEMSKKYDDVLYLPIGSSLSSSCNTSITICSEFKNFHVFDNNWVGDQYNEIIEHVKKVYEKYQSMDKVFEELEWIKKNSIVYILPIKLRYLIEGGRVSSFKKILLKTMNKLRIYPHVKYVNQKVSTAGVARGVKNAIIQIFNKLISFANVKKLEDLTEKYKIDWIHGIDEELNNTVKQLAESKNLKIDSERWTSSAIAVHTGPEAFSLSIMPKLEKREI